MQYLLLKSGRFVTNHKFQSLMFDMKLVCMGIISFDTGTGDPSLVDFFWSLRLSARDLFNKRIWNWSKEIKEPCHEYFTLSQQIFFSGKSIAHIIYRDAAPVCRGEDSRWDLITYEQWALCLFLPLVSWQRGPAHTGQWWDGDTSPPRVEMLADVIFTSAHFFHNCDHDKYCK